MFLLDGKGLNSLPFSTLTFDFRDFLGFRLHNLWMTISGSTDLARRLPTCADVGLLVSFILDIYELSLKG